MHIEDLTPERTLVAAVLWQAITDMEGNGTDADMARQWLTDFSTDFRAHLGFRWCCEVLGLNPERTRDRILINLGAAGARPRKQ